MLKIDSLIARDLVHKMILCVVALWEERRQHSSQKHAMNGNVTGKILMRAMVMTISLLR